MRAQAILNTKTFIRRMEPQLQAPDEALNTCIIIPCYDEVNLIRTLDSLARNLTFSGLVEVFVVLNDSVDDNIDIQKNNHNTYLSALKWASAQTHDQLKFYCLDATRMPVNDAGVGLARKIGMDLAAQRLCSVQHPDGIILNLDADCEVQTNYIQAVQHSFNGSKACQAASIYFEHPLTRDLPEAEYVGIINYELFLRYYIRGLIYAGHPHAYHTLGSCMAVTAKRYLSEGGMNKRKAGEDFYFLHKLIPLGKFRNIVATTIYPSSRPSHRVPFGTGKAIQQWLDSTQKVYSTYNPQIFNDLKTFLEYIPHLWEINSSASLEIDSMPKSIQDFLGQSEPGGFEKRLNEIKLNSTSLARFVSRFFRWFNGFRVLKYVHYARDHYYANMPIETVANTLLNSIQYEKAEQNLSAFDLLMFYRDLDCTQPGKI
ncbi:MAG: hypothetical protein ACI9CF_001190 [Candidatus Omnitrophota bacterium]|jgi:hypothetical protein